MTEWATLDRRQRTGRIVDGVACDASRIPFVPKRKVPPGAHDTVTFVTFPAPTMPLPLATATELCRVGGLREDGHGAYAVPVSTDVAKVKRPIASDIQRGTAIVLQREPPCQ